METSETSFSRPLEFSQAEALRNSPLNENLVENVVATIDSVQETLEVHCIVGENDPTCYVAQGHKYAKVKQNHSLYRSTTV